MAAPGAVIGGRSPITLQADARRTTPLKPSPPKPATTTDEPPIVDFGGDNPGRGAGGTLVSSK